MHARHMYYFSIRDIENLTGIKAHTLRVWEQRYNFFTPKRKESQHRMYDNEDLKQLLRFAFLYHQGWKASRLAQLTPGQALQEVQQYETGKSRYEYNISLLLEKAIDFDKDGFEQQLAEMTDSLGFEAAIEQVCYPLLNKIGLLWMTNHVIPAQEHFCSYIIQHKIIAQTDKLPQPPDNAPQIVLFCPHGEYHELPLFYINYLLKKWGWSTFYLGSNVSIDLLQPFAEKENIRFFFTHLITNFTGFSVDDYFEKLCRAFPQKNIVTSGTSVFGMQRQFVNLKVLKNDAEIIEFIQTKKASNSF